MDNGCLSKHELLLEILRKRVDSAAELMNDTKVMGVDF